jgi:hypothetical protein
LVSHTSYTTLNSLQFESFVQAATPWTAGKQSSGSIFEFKRANNATNPKLQGSALAPPPIPLSHYPEKENRRKKKQQINRNQRAKTDRNHGAVGGVARAG